MAIQLLRIFAKSLVRAEWEKLRFEVTRRQAMLSHLSVPVGVQRMLVSGEDHRHSRHSGFDVHAICRAIWRRVRYGRREGASTIEQQIVRVLTNGFEPTLRRKVREILLATLVAEMLPKSVTPALYLTIGYYGWRMNGFRQACQRLGLRPQDISLDAAAELVARLKYPEPRIITSKRLTEIVKRRDHLKRLYRTHLADGTYNYLGGSNINGAVQTGAGINEGVLSISGSSNIPGNGDITGVPRSLGSTMA